MDPITNRPISPPTTTQTESASTSDQPAPAAKTSAQQMPQGSGLPESGGGPFEFPLLTKPNLGGLDPGNMLLALSMSLEKTEFSTAEQELKDHIAGVKRHAETKAAYLDSRANSITRMQEAEQTIANFKSGTEADLAAATSEKNAATAEIVGLNTQLSTGVSGSARAELESKLAAAQNNLANADSRIQSAQNLLDQLDSSPAGTDRLRLTAMSIQGAELTPAEQSEILSAAVTGGAIPVALIGQLAGPDAMAAAERAVTGLGKLGAANAGTADAFTYAAMVDGGDTVHPTEKAYNELGELAEQDEIVGQILSALYRTGEIDENTQDILDQISATVDVVGQRFSGKEAVDENIQLEYRNKISI